MKEKKQNSKPTPGGAQYDARKLDVKNEIKIENSGAGQPHNAKKEGLGPNTKR